MEGAWAPCHDDATAVPDGPQGLSQPILDPNISNMKGSLSKGGPYTHIMEHHARLFICTDMERCQRLVMILKMQVLESHI